MIIRNTYYKLADRNNPLQELERLKSIEKRDLPGPAT